MLKQNLIFFLFFSLLVTAFGQTGRLEDDISKSEQNFTTFFRDTGYVPDISIVEKYNPRKPLWIPFSEALGQNLFIWTFNRYIADQPHARISWETMKKNLRHGWDWDADNLSTNMFGHPFGGGLYYTWSRTSGYNYWVSLGVAAFGSLQWEFFMENEPAAWNDFIMTTFAGAMYGEMFYRFANLILDESTSGSERTWREIGGGLLPVNRWINRLIYGRSSRHLDYHLYEREPNVGEVTLGANYVAEGADFKNADRNQVVALEYIYGRLFFKRYYKPLDHFSFYTLLNFGGNQPGLGQFRIFGVITAKQKRYNNGNRLLWGLFQAADYLDNNVYEIAGYSVGPGIGFRTAPNKPHAFGALFNGSIMLMGAANSDYAPNWKVEELDSARTYNMGMGAGAKLNGFWLFPRGDLTLNYSFWWVHTMQGAPGDEFIGILQPKLRIGIIGRWFVGLQYLLYHRIGKYKDYDDINLRNNEGRAFIGLRF